MYLINAKKFVEVGYEFDVNDFIINKFLHYNVYLAYNKHINYWYIVYIGDYKINKILRWLKDEYTIFIGGNGYNTEEFERLLCTS